MPKRLKLIKGFLNNQSINEVVGLNIAYSNSNYGAENFPSAYAIAEPQGIAFDAFGNLWAVDNYRPAILMYPPQNQFNGQPATFQIGQSNFNTHANSGVTQSAFDLPTLIAFDKNNNLWVYDKNANRILGFQYPFGSGGILNASWVIGQVSFTTSVTGVSANLFSNTINGIVFDNQNNLWVADSSNNRVMGFSSSKIYSINPSASWVIGQPSFTSNTINNGGISAKTLYKPYSVAIDKNGYLWVGDLGNYRLLGYKNPQGIMPSADYVIGQTSFSLSTYGVTQYQFSGTGVVMPIAFDNSGNLWVYDYYRILGFEAANLYGNNQPNASYLMFQTSYTAELTSTLSQGYTTQYDMSGFFYQTAIPNEEIVTALPNPYQIDYGFPLYLAFNSKNDMWISDTSNYRLVQYKNSDITSNVYPYNCSAVLGQSQFYIQGKTGETQYNLDYVRDVAFDKNNNLWIADSFSIKGFQYPNYSQQVMQNWVIGGTFTTTGGLTQYGLSQPQTVSFDNFGNMYVSDCSQNRIMGFSASSLYGNNEPNAFVVIGQANFTTSTAATTQNGLTINIGNLYNYLAGKVAFDSNNNMYVADTSNNRIMIFLYGSGFTNGMNASIVLGQTSFTTLTTGTTASNLNKPTYLIFDKTGNLWVADTTNNRVQKFVPPFTTGMSATVSITGFNKPSGLAFDGMGNLLVADNSNNRILGFPSSVLNASTTVSSATIVLGQPNFTQVTVGLGLQSLNSPQGLAINPATGDLICADNQNNRIVGWYYLHKQTQSNALNSKYIFYNE